MKLRNYSVKDTLDVFGSFDYSIDQAAISEARCMLYENTDGDDWRAVYRLYIDNQPKYYAVCSVKEEATTVARESEFVKTWARASESRLIEQKEDQFSHSFLFELIDPFSR